MADRLMVEFDKAGAEWVVVAYASGDPTMIDVCETGRSPHLITGSLISRATPELVLKEHKTFERLHVEHLTDPNEIEEIRRKHLPELFKGDYFLPRTMTIRQCGKKSNHGINYKMGPIEFSNFTEMDQTDCKRVIEYYTRVAYPNIPLWWESIKRQLRDDRTLYNCFGRKRRFYDPWGEDLHKKGIAFVPQSTVVDLVNIGLKKLYADSRLSRTWDLLAQTHDSITTQVLYSDIKRLAQQCIKIGLDYLNAECEYSGQKFKIGTDMKIGYSWGKLEPVKLTNDIDKVAADLKIIISSVSHNRKKAA